MGKVVLFISMGLVMLGAAGWFLFPGARTDLIQSLPFFGSSSSGQVTLTYWGLWEPKEVIQPLLDEYQSQNTNITIEYQMRDPETHYETIQSRLGGEGAPDIIRVHSTWIPFLQNKLVPIASDVLSTSQYEEAFYRAKTPVYQDTNPADDILVKRDGKYFGIPLMIDGLALVYNRDLFLEEGIVNPPGNWNELRDYSKQLTKKNSRGEIVQAGAALGYSENIDYFSDIIGLMFAQNGVRFVDKDEKVTFHQTLSPIGSNLATEALSFYSLFATTEQSWDPTWRNSTLEFTDGRVAMVLLPSHRLHEVLGKAPDFEVGVSLAPQLAITGSQDDAIYWGNYWVETVSKTSKNSKEAWKFLKWLSGKDLIQKELDKEKNLANLETLELQTIDAAKYLVEYDFVLSLGGKEHQSIATRQEKAAFIAEELEKLELVQDAQVIKIITEQTNPTTQETFDYQENFNRVGVRLDDEDKEDESISILPAISIGLNKKTGTDAIELSEKIRSEMELLEEDNKLVGYEVIYTGDVAIDINYQINSLQENAMTGLIAVIVIVFLFVSLRSAILSAIFIITVMSATFVGLYAIGYSLNVISLFALILVLGLFVDDAIVVVEAINYKVRQGFKGTVAVRKAIEDIGLADILGTITTLLVFAPMAFTSGILGEFIRLIPITVILSLSLSIILAITIIPFVANLLLALTQRNKPQEVGDKPFVNVSDVVLVRYDIASILTAGPGRLIRKFGNKISQFISWYLAKPGRKYLVIAQTIILIVLGTMYASNLTFSVFPSPKDADYLTVSASYPAGTSITQTENIADDIEAIIIDKYEEEINRIDYYYANRDGLQLFLNLTEMSQRDITAITIQDTLDEEFEEWMEDNENDANIKVELMSAGPPTADYPFAMQVFDDDPVVLEKAGKVIQNFLDEREIENDEIVSEVVVDNSDLISKRNGRRYIQVKAKISDATNTGLIITLRDQIIDEFDEDVLETLNLETDALEFDFGQESENLESFESTMVALAVALVLMYILLITQYNSFLLPLLIFMAIPFSFPGLFPGLFLTNNSLSFFTALGIMGLTGIVVNNTIILVDFANRKRDQGLSINEAITESIRIRFRPILATSATTIAGLLPLGLSDPFWESLTFSIIFGLISSTTLVLLAFPAFFSVFEDIRKLKEKIPGYQAIRANNGADNEHVDESPFDQTPA